MNGSLLRISKVMVTGRKCIESLSGTHTATWERGIKQASFQHLMLKLLYNLVVFNLSQFDITWEKAG